MEKKELDDTLETIIEERENIITKVVSLPKDKGFEVRNSELFMIDIRNSILPENWRDVTIRGPKEVVNQVHSVKSMYFDISVIQNAGPNIIDVHIELDNPHPDIEILTKLQQEVYAIKREN